MMNVSHVALLTGMDHSSRTQFGCLVNTLALVSLTSGGILSFDKAEPVAANCAVRNANAAAKRCRALWHILMKEDNLADNLTQILKLKRQF